MILLVLSEDRFRNEWIKRQISTVLPIVRNGLRLRAEILEQARDTLDGLAADFQRLYEQTR